MVMAQGLDYSARKLSGRVIRDSGFAFVLRYLDFPGQRVSYLDAAEMADLAANGVEVHAVYEQNTDDPAGGYSGGRRMAAQAVASALKANLPAGHTIFMCADGWLSSHGIPVATAMEFLDGARSIIGSTHYELGAYGFRDFVFAAAAGGHADRFWLCGAELPEEHRPNWLHLYQWNNGSVRVDAVECDLNKMYRPLIDGGSAGGGHAVPGRGETDMLIKNLDPEHPAANTVALVSGGIVSAVDTQWAEETNTKAGGGLLIGVSGAVWDDLVDKSTALESVPGLLADVLAELKKLPHSTA